MLILGAIAALVDLIQETTGPTRCVIHPYPLGVLYYLITNALTLKKKLFMELVREFLKRCCIKPPWCLLLRLRVAGILAIGYIGAFTETLALAIIVQKGIFSHFYHLSSTKAYYLNELSTYR